VRVQATTADLVNGAGTGIVRTCGARRSDGRADLPGTATAAASSGIPGNGEWRSVAGAAVLKAIWSVSPALDEPAVSMTTILAGARGPPSLSWMQPPRNSAGSHRTAGSGSVAGRPVVEDSSQPSAYGVRAGSVPGLGGCVTGAMREQGEVDPGRLQVVASASLCGSGSVRRSIVASSPRTVRVEAKAGPARRHGGDNTPATANRAGGRSWAVGRRPSNGH